MSAIEQLSLDAQERRGAERLRVGGSVSVIFGRGEGVLIDLSARGARIRHHAPARRGATVRVSFEWERARFSATAEVLASRVVSLGNGPSYESRVRFTAFDAGAEFVLERALEELTGRNIRRWVANLRGWNEESQPQPARVANGSFIRCRLHGTWWERKITNDPTQPNDGFVLAADATEAEIETLCDTYSHATDEERHVIRMMAAAAAEK
jgi:PilZ domain